ncbi:hypothetical protein DL765_011075 [Monosporascus sp. GIB2]|nr:hypothetical protein DL765_011075 [Monosporascus sp. GIB2]
MRSELWIGLYQVYAGVVGGDQVRIQPLSVGSKNWVSEQDPLMSKECVAPRIKPVNSTTGEQWEFDGISEDGKQSFMIGFYRDPSFAFLGTGNLRFYLEFSFANASRYAVVEYAEESVVERCPGREFGSNLERGLVVPSVMLVENGNPIFSTRLTEPSETEDHLVLRKVYDGNGTTTE